MPGRAPFGANDTRTPSRAKAFLCSIVCRKAYVRDRTEAEDEALRRDAPDLPRSREIPRQFGCHGLAAWINRHHANARRHLPAVLRPQFVLARQHAALRF